MEYRISSSAEGVGPVPNSKHPEMEEYQTKNSVPRCEGVGLVPKV